VPSSWATIDALVHDIGELSAQVLMAEHTLATDARTRAARTGLDLATDAVSTAIDERSESAARRASEAIAETRALIVSLGLSIERSRSLVEAARRLTATSQREHSRTAALRRRVVARRRGRS
jgi:signal transduction histidine kinase